MATQQHPAFDPNQPIVAAELPRIGGLRKDYVGAGQNTEIGDKELRAAAEAEARSWSELDADGKIVAIEAKWKAVKAAVEAKLIEIRDAMTIGMKTTGDAEIFFASAAALRNSLQQTKAMLKKVARPAAGEGWRVGIGEIAARVCGRRELLEYGWNAV